MLHQVKKLTFWIVFFSSILYGQDIKYLVKGQEYTALQPVYVLTEAKFDSVLLQIADGKICSKELSQYKKLYNIQDDYVLTSDSLFTFIKKQDSIYVSLNRETNRVLNELKYKNLWSQIKLVLITSGIVMAVLLLSK